MENASKALIIAGAILISILLISVGIIIMNAINEPVQQSANSANSQAVQTFNAEFLSYEGSQTGATLRSLISLVNTHNANNDNHIGINTAYTASARYTTANLDTTGTHPFNASHNYTVTLDYGGEGGRISQINVTW